MKVNTFRFTKRIASRPGQGEVFPHGTLRYAITNQKRIKEGEVHRFQIPILGVIFDVHGSLLALPSPLPTPTQKGQNSLDLSPEGLTLQPGAQEFLEFLEGENRPTRTGLVSQSERSAEYFQRVSELVKNPSFTLSLGHQFLARGNPNPASVFLFSKKWGLMPPNLLFVSPSHSLLSRMKATGVLTCQFRAPSALDPKRDPKNLTKKVTVSTPNDRVFLDFNPDISVESYEELTDLILKEEINAEYIPPQTFRDTEIKELIANSGQQIVFSAP